ncbi:7-cyano-7-deazaguanine synthase QueC [Alicyclobacillus fastidiosus]|uniref:7-cyano-7-deazaguanine synthase n=1 Tax=Alicyclobacillus fastidiosus TaxID=392011 RepID=A0ABY6ZJU9_9BACL|nr:7-cyano-7-deazaguanine synthase QueC [Alicyclobacillus fastidiosus]WAH42873.1 7-cyano-7-deazaguanine synthase QueC [Alicyclobacillus fastidiosus]GMA64812.1 7-cyano-7-deazaguanine synthase [Alicyclobacillus fastidiosus]
MEKAVVILSGGLDSTTCMGLAKEQGFELFPVTFDYGQRHNIELECATAVAKHYNVADHRVVKLDFLRQIGGSALTDKDIEVPQDGVTDEIPVTYVPGRNLLFLSMAASYAEVIGASAIYIGVNALDYSGYPDCRPEFIEAVQETIARGTKAGVEGRPIRIETPLLHWTKAEIIRHGMEIGVPYQLTTSCYMGEAVACGECDSCRLRLKGFAEAGYRDPISYRDDVNLR